MSENLGEARRLLKDTGAAVTKQNHILYEFEEWEAIDRAVAQLENDVKTLIEWGKTDNPIEERQKFKELAEYIRDALMDEDLQAKKD